MRVIDEIPGLYRIIELDPFRRTQGVVFDLVPMSILPRIDAIDRVIHEQGAVSPGPVKGVERPWYMHDYQDDNLLVLSGRREVDLYGRDHDKVEHFSVTPTEIWKNGELIADNGAILVWPRKVFHRIVSGPQGSASLNLAVHYEGFDIRYNFNIYDLDVKTGRFELLRAGYLDQFQNIFE